jgi:iron complex transport system ATP-binding protein
MSLRAEGVVVRAGAAELLRGVDLEVAAGEVLAVVGPNGAGKSTLLRALAGDRSLGAGSVTMDGRPLAGWSLAERALRRAVIGADEELAFPWKAAEVVMLGRIPQHGGDPGPLDHAIVARLLADVDALQLADRTHPTLSSGERQRIALARALAQLWPDDLPPDAPWTEAARQGGGPGAGAAGRAERTPAWFLLDEPTANLDLRHQALALRLLRARAALGAGVVVILHDLNLAAAHADRVAILDQGRIVAIGTPAEVLQTELLERVFGLPMLVVPHPDLPHPLVVPDPTA